MKRVVWIPEAHRTTDVSITTAKRMLRCTDRSFSDLVALGLPHVDGPEGPLFNSFDLKNVSLFSASNVTEVEMSMRFLLSFMGESRSDLTKPIRRTYRVRVLSGKAPVGTRAAVLRVYRPYPEAFGGELVSWGPEARTQVSLDGHFFRMAVGAGVTGELVNRGVEQKVRSTEIRAVVHDLLSSGVRWHYLPKAMVQRPYEAVGLGAASCSVLCSVLEDRLHGLGYEAIAYHGWINAAAPVEHGWVEVLDEDGVMKCLDPSLALLAVDNGFGDRDYFEFAIGSAQNRVMPTKAPLNSAFIVDDDRADAHVLFSSRVEEGVERAGPHQRGTPRGLRRSRR